MLLALALATTLHAVPADQVHLTPGTQEVLKLPGLRKVALVNEDIASVRVTNSTTGELLLLGKQSGRTQLTLWVGDKILYKTIVVDNGRAEGIARLVHDQVSPTLTVAEYNGRIVIDGTLDAVEEMDRLRILVGDDPNVKLLVHMNPRVLPFVASQISQALEREGLRSAHAIAVGNKIFLEGSVADAAELQKAQSIADAIYSQSQIGLSTAH
jgi:Flp pilus assembly secretin CpaC